MDGEEAIGILAFFIVAFIFLAFLLGSKAVLVYEKGVWGGYECTYFTGTRVITFTRKTPTGCKRIIDVGE